MKGTPGLLEFLQDNPTEQACRERLRELRWGKGFACPRCKENQRWSYLRTREKWQCNACKYQCSVTAGTILQDTKIGVRKWFLAIYLVVTNKKGISGYDLARKLQVTEKTGWFLHRKILKILRSRKKMKLSGVVEVDEALFGGKRSDGTTGRGSSKPLVLGLVEHRGQMAGRLRLLRIPDASHETLARAIRHHVEPGSRLLTDGWASYAGLSDYVHDRRVGDGVKELRWVHTVFSNAKRVVYGVNSYTSHDGLGPYLDGFEYRFDYRNHLGDGVRRAIRGLRDVLPNANRFLRVHQPGVWRANAATSQ